MLKEREYKSKIIDAAIDKARSVKREDAIKKVEPKEASDKVVFVTHYDPRLPSMPHIIRKHFRSMHSGQVAITFSGQGGNC